MESPAGNLQTQGEIGPELESGFARGATWTWIVLALGAQTAGLLVGWLLTTCSMNIAGTLALSLGLFGFSLILCRGLSLHLIRRPRTNAVLLALALPLASHLPISLGGMVVFGSRKYLDVAWRETCGVGYSLAFFWLVAPVWGIIAAVRRRRLFAAAPQIERQT